MDRSSESAQKGFGHLYTRFKPEIWYWGLAVEISKKWFMVFWYSFLPTGALQFSMILSTLMLYWLFHFKCAPYHTNWKIHATLENDMQNWLYFFEVLFLITSFVYSKIGGNEFLWTVGLSCIYFSSVIMMMLKLSHFVERYKVHKRENEQKVKVKNRRLKKKKVLPEEMKLSVTKTQESTYNEIITKANGSEVAKI